ncbi:MAG TPA: ATP-binding protein [Acidimicrobiales bacterium]|nr:ATP-binding protein [Acidimicrobiales bacterium]
MGRAFITAAHWAEAVEESFELGSTLDTPSLARQVVRDVLYRWDMVALVDDAELIASELVANAVVHAGGATRLALTGERGSYLRIEVTDGDNRPPMRGKMTGDALSGRGLNIVFALAAAWGSAAGPSGPGKTVWAEISTVAHPR